MLTYTLPYTIYEDLAKYEKAVDDFLKGRIEPEKFKGIRVPFGIYEQRKSGTYMVRIRLSGGIITPKQLYVIAELADKYGSEKLHVTTRQDIQIHDVVIENTVYISKGLIECGLSSKGGGGNTVRNIVMSVDAGINPLEPYDITPVVVGLTNDLLKEDDSFNLPRKFKITFSNTYEDSACATISDVGFIARIKEGKKGFKVYVGGGLGRKSRIAELLYDFITINEVYQVVNGVKLLFYKYGNRKNRHSARLRFLYNKLGREEFIKLFEREKEKFELKDYEALYKEERNFLNDIINLKPEEPIDEGFGEWKRNYVKEQKQKGFYTIEIPLKNGDISTEDAKKLAKFLENFGEDVIRFSINQNIHLRNIKGEYLPNVYNIIKQLDTNSDNPRIISDIIACKGADTCQLGICKPRGAVSKIYELISENIELFSALGRIQINISGCPNSCGKHLIGNLGFFGKAKRNDGYLYPAYNVLVGGKVEDGGTKFGEKIGEISAKKMPYFVIEVLKDFAESGLASFQDYLNKFGESRIREILKDFEYVPSFEEDNSFYYDWNSDELFNVNDIGPGECSASMFDLVELYLEQLVKYKKKVKEINGKDKLDLLNEMIFKSVKMLLLLKGYDAESNEQLIKLFDEHYFKTGLVSTKYENIVRLLIDNQSLTTEREDEILEFVDTVKRFYDELDESLNIVTGIDEPKEKDKVSEPEIKVFKDYRGVSCPLNFVRIKVDLAGMKSGDLLEVYLDDGDPIDNVPRSVAMEGHEIIEQKRIDNYWSVVIRKK
ncbi:sulfite reductase subunit beta (hemoprotein) [Deferribacter autotrophicus]|uniref:Sulfite reductase subunit beta (Hemoprotein) n=1 Tax=Deferribacter autotrophicus TaxID=500465 RepID=A0A5A8F1E2_9BACT|nr:sulfurtransferase TusA family protein [Deferribacter autotrophicus]KAA0257166.1 sulfite reductase subunit beta (hemoprotein) [Deferribacter autotrophicus]